MAAVETLITDHLDLWTAALKRKSTAGRGSSSKVELYGIKKLRELILELAVRGLLVPQDPNDEPASELLKRIAAEKAKLVKEGAIKKEKPLPAISDEAVPFVVPHGWKWARIADIGHDFGQKTPDANFTYIDVGAIDNRLGLIDCPATLMAEDAPSRARKLVSRGTVIYSTVRPYLLNVAIVQKDFDPEPIASTAFAVVHPFEGIVSGYVYRYLRSPSFVAYVESVQTGIAYPAINDRQFFSGLIPLPPTAEQHRIVAKVDELMALCDQLEQQTDASLGAHQTLVKTLLSALTSAADLTQFVSAWQRIAGHFNTLFTTEESIEQLKQTILQLAVMGKLVPQHPYDEAASVLFEKILREKKRLIDQGELRKLEPLPEVRDEETPFSLASGWAYVRLGDISKLITKGSSPKWQGVSYTEDPSDVLFVTSENVGSFALLLDNKKYVEKKFNEVEPRSILNSGDFLMNIVGASIGRTAIFDIDSVANINQAVCLIRVFAEMLDSKFLLLFFNSATCVSYMFDKQVENARANLSMGNIAKFLVPLPPLEEQHRIVAKVDELMALCDQLKSRLSDAQTTQLHLADALVEQAIG